MRSKKALISTVVSFVLQIVNIIAALIIPRLIIENYGSSVNGLISSITQFLGYISLLQMGVGGVTRAALYKPLAFQDTKQISRVIKATEGFFRKIAYISIVYICALAIIYPYIVENNFGKNFIAIMVVIIGISTVMQYFFGFPYRLLILADQRSYIYDMIQIAAIFMNVVVTYILINVGCNIQIVKLGSAIVFIIQPIVLNYYVSKRYNIDKKVEPDNVAIEQRWAGMGYSLADFIHRKTDIFILTIMSTLQEVSVYSVYSVVTNGLNSIITMATNSFQAALGDMIAKKEETVLKETLNLYIFLVHLISSIIFSVAIIMILSFVRLYTKGIYDVNYERPIFAVLILLAEMVYCMRQPYQSLVFAAGKFRETQKGAIIEAVINIIVSMILVNYLGLVGVAIGTFIAMIFRTIDLVKYLSSSMLDYKYSEFIKRYVISFSSVVISYVLCRQIPIKCSTFSIWIVYAIVISVLIGSIICLINYVFYRNEFKNTVKKFSLVFRSMTKRGEKND